MPSSSATLMKRYDAPHSAARDPMSSHERRSHAAVQGRTAAYQRPRRPRASARELAGVDRQAPHEARQARQDRRTLRGVGEAQRALLAADPEVEDLRRRRVGNRVAPDCT